LGDDRQETEVPRECGIRSTLSFFFKKRARSRARR